MKNTNQKSKNIFWYILMFFSFGIGLILYLIIKSRTEKTQSKEINSDEIVPDDNVESLELTSRQKLILSEIKKGGRIYPTTLAKLLPEISTRTIRREMTKLSELGLVKQEGSTKSTYYTYINKD